MTKRKKNMLIFSVAIIAVVLAVWGANAAIRAYKDSKIRYTVNDTLPDGQGKKVNVIFLGGQSNASGCSLDEYLKKNVTPEKYAEYEAGYDNVYINYFATGTNQSQAFVKCATRQGEQGLCFGPELGLAEKLNEMYPDELFFIIKWAWGGSNLYDQWLSPSSSGDTGEYYKHFVKFAQASIEYLVSKNYDVEIEGMCWMQGESDSFWRNDANNYARNLNNFIEDIRQEFASYAAPDGIAFVDATIAKNPSLWLFCDLVNQSKQTVAEKSAMNVLIDTNAAGLTCTQEPEEQPDTPHYDSMSQIKLGNLFSEELGKFIN